jgi:RHS repeat-associated protein
LVEFKYDYMGRRVEKKYSLRSGSSWVVQNGFPQRFVYEGWNPVLVLNGENETVRKYTWGLDLSGTIHGAAGIGGLLACVETQGEHQGTYWYFYDANGNVSEILDATDSENLSIAAHYEYDPYGNVINNISSYAYAATNPIRFSTKWFDPETGLGYWGYRYYSPRLGRWISRDPIGEKGGINLYVLVTNSPTNSVDPSGQTALDAYKKARGLPVPKAMGINSNAVAQLKIWGWPGIDAGLGGAIMFFGDTCEIALFKVQAGWADAPGGIFHPLPPEDGGEQLGVGAGGEFAWLVGPGPASASTYTGMFWDASASVAGVSGKGFFGERSPAGTWHGWGIGVGAGPPGAGTMGWLYTLQVSRTMTNYWGGWCACVALCSQLLPSP